MAIKAEYKNISIEHFEKFWNQCFDKGQLKAFVFWFLKTYGENQTVSLLEKLKDTGFKYATKAGVSISIDDLKIPNSKSRLISEAEKQIFEGVLQYGRGNITGVERFQKLIDTWHRTSEVLKQEVINHFEMTDTLNPVYMMAFSGARGNVSQVRQLVGMRGLMADPQGQIIDFPIRSNFREGLTLTEYIISSYGARKGIVDTALRTANAGYLTRRLVDVAQHVIVAQFDCETQRGIFVMNLKEGNKTLYALQNRLIGRVLGKDLSWKKKIIAYRNQEISVKLASQISLIFQRVFIRSPLTCETKKLVCQLCYGWSLAQGNLVSIGEAVGIIAAQSIGEPGTQLTMRTFHTGGVFSGDITDQIIAPFDGFVEYSEHIPGTLIRTSEGKLAFLTKSEGSFILHATCKQTFNENESKNEEISLKKSFIGKHTKKAELTKKVYKIPSYTVLFIRNTESFFEKQVLAQISIFSKQKKQRDDEERNMKSAMEGEVFHGHMSILEQINDYNELKFESWDWGYTWVLAGRIYQFPIRSHLFPKFGDLVGNRSSLNRIHWYISDTCSLEIQNVGNSKLKKSISNQNDYQNESSLIFKNLKKTNIISISKTRSSQSSVSFGALYDSENLTTSSLITFDKSQINKSIGKEVKCYLPEVTHKNQVTSNLQAKITQDLIPNFPSYSSLNTNNPYLFSLFVDLKPKDFLGLTKNEGPFFPLKSSLKLGLASQMKRNNFARMFNPNENFKTKVMTIKKQEKTLFMNRKTQQKDIMVLPMNVKHIDTQGQFGLNYHILLKKSLLNLDIQKIDYKRIGYFIFLKQPNSIHFDINEIKTTVELVKLTSLNEKNDGLVKLTPLKVCDFKKKKADKSPFSRIQKNLQNFNEKSEWKTCCASFAKKLETQPDSFFIPFSLNFQSFSLLKNQEQSTSKWSPQSNFMMLCFPSMYQILGSGLFSFFLINTTNKLFLTQNFSLKSYPFTLQNESNAIKNLDKSSLTLKKRLLSNESIKLSKKVSSFEKNNEQNKYGSKVVLETKMIKLEWRNLKRLHSKAKQQIEYLGRIAYVSQPSFQIKTLVNKANLHFSDKVPSSVIFKKSFSLINEAGLNGHIIPFLFKTNRQGIAQPFAFQTKNNFQIFQITQKPVDLKSFKKTEPTHFLVKTHFKKRYSFLLFVKILNYFKKKQKRKNNPILLKNPSFQFACANLHPLKSKQRVETNNSNITLQKDTPSKIYHWNLTSRNKKRTTFLSSILLASNFSSDSLFLPNKHFTKILLTNENVRNTLKFQELKIQVKKGWIYIPSVNFNPSFHKTFIPAGKTFVDDLIFDKNIIYVEALASNRFSNKNWLEKLNPLMRKPNSFDRNVFKRIYPKNWKDYFSFTQNKPQNHLSNLNSKTPQTISFQKTEPISRLYWIKSSTIRYKPHIQNLSPFGLKLNSSQFEANSFVDFMKLNTKFNGIDVQTNFFLILRNVKHYYLPKLQTFKNKLYNCQVRSQFKSLLNLKYYQSLVLNKQKTDKFLPKFPNVDFRIQSILVNETNRLNKDLKTDPISVSKNEVLAGENFGNPKSKTAIYFSKNAVNLSPFELKSFSSSHSSYPFQIPLFSLMNKANSNYVEQLDLIHESKSYQRQNKTHVKTKGSFEFTSLTNSRTKLWAYLLDKTNKSENKHGKLIKKETNRVSVVNSNHEFFLSSLNLLKNLSHLLSLPSLSFGVGQKLNYLLNPRIYASYISRQNQGESFKGTLFELCSKVPGFESSSLRDKSFVFDQKKNSTNLLVSQIFSKNNSKRKNLLKLMSKNKLTKRNPSGFEFATLIKPLLPFSPIYPFIRNQLFLNQKNQILSSSFFASTLFLSPFKGEILTPSHSDWLSLVQNQNINTSSTLKEQLILTATDLISFSLGNQTFKEIYEFEKQPTHLINKQKSNASSATKFIRFKEKTFKVQGLRLGYPSQNKRRGTTLCLGQFMFYADFLQRDTSINQSGLLIHVNQSKITLRKGQPFFVSPKSLLHQPHGGFVHKNESVVTLTYQRVKTGDIVQGIPLLEQIFEARTTKKGRLFRDSLPNILDGIFLRSCLKLSRKKAVRQSFYKIRQIIVDGVQRVYRSQGVMVADKHIELIVKEMTSKVRIVNRGVTGFFPGELIDLDFVEFLNTKFIKKIKYAPCILGISKASLSADSFLSAASFQHTIKVLSRAAIYKKQDFLRGLKENVIVGSLPPTGTGYFTHMDDRIKFQTKYRKSSLNNN